MKRFSCLIVLLLALRLVCFAQSPIDWSGLAAIGGPLTALSLYPGWAYGQDIYINVSCGNGPTCSTTEAYFPLPLTANSCRVLTVGCSGSGQTAVTISSASINSVALTPCTACGPGSIIENNTIVDMAYGVGTGGTGADLPISATMSGTCNGMQMFLEEFVPQSGYSCSYDTANNNYSAGCLSCSGPSLATTATDLIYVNGYNASPVNSQTSGCQTPYVGDGQESCIYYNAPPGSPTALTMEQASSGPTAFYAIAFKTSAGTYTTPTPNLSLVHFDCGSGAPCAGGATATTCHSTCSITIESTTAGNHGLLWYEIQNSSSFSTVLSTATVGGFSLTIPSGSNTCAAPQVDSGGTYFHLGCAYILSLPGSANSLSLSFSANATVYWGWYESKRIIGSWTLDAQNSASLAASYTPQGPSITPTGANDEIFYAIAGYGGFGGMTLASSPFGGGGDDGSWANGATFGGVLLNSTNGAGPYYMYQDDLTTTAAVIAFE